MYFRKIKNKEAYDKMHQIRIIPFSYGEIFEFPY